MAGRIGTVNNKANMANSMPKHKETKFPVFLPSRERRRTQVVSPRLEMTLGRPFPCQARPRSICIESRAPLNRNARFGRNTGPSTATVVGPLSAQLRRPRPRSATPAQRRHRPSAAQASAVSADGRPRKTLNAADFGAQSATERDHVFFVEERSDPFLRDSPLKFREGFVVARK